MFENNHIKVVQFKTSPEAEATGAIMAAWLNHQLADETRDRLAAHGITEIDYEQYYPFQTFLDVMREIAESENNTTMQLVSVGKAAAMSIEMDDFPDMAAFEGFISVLHGLNVRNMPEYEGWFSEWHDGNLYVLNNTPVSNDLVFGFLWELLNHVKIGDGYYTPIPHEHYPSNERGSIFHIEPRED
ncbi:MAG: hypothetical protein AAFV33_00105 [Chloroflexota bacterium]